MSAGRVSRTRSSAVQPAFNETSVSVVGACRREGNNIASSETGAKLVFGKKKENSILFINSYNEKNE